MKNISITLGFLLAGLWVTGQNNQATLACVKRIQLSNGTTFNSTSGIKSASGKQDEKSKICYIAETGYSFGLKDYTIDFLKLNAICSYKLNPYFSIGLGTGLRYAIDVKDALLPFYADFRSRITNKPTSLYASLDIGYSLDITSDLRTEGFYFLFNPAAGVSFKMKDKLQLNIGIGYDFQKFKMSYALYDVVPGTTINTTGISVNAGISF